MGKLELTSSQSSVKPPALTPVTTDGASHWSANAMTGDYCDVYLTHDSMSVRKAHNSGRNHLRNVVDYYQRESVLLLGLVLATSPCPALI